MTAPHDLLIRDFLLCFEEKDSARLATFLSPDVVFQNYGEPAVRGRDAVRDLWQRIFGIFASLRFETVHQAIDGDIVLAEQVHALALPGRVLTPIMNMAVYEIADGKIASWRDYSNPAHARELLGASAESPTGE